MGKHEQWGNTGVTKRNTWPRLRKGTSRLRKETPRLRKGIPDRGYEKEHLTKVTKRNSEGTKRNNEVTKRNIQAKKKGPPARGYEKEHRGYEKEHGMISTVYYCTKPNRCVHSLEYWTVVVLRNSLTPLTPSRPKSVHQHVCILGGVKTFATPGFFGLSHTIWNGTISWEPSYVQYPPKFNIINQYSPWG